jgi:hypothetical protein
MVSSLAVHAEAAAREVLEHLHLFPSAADISYPELAKYPEPERQSWQGLWQEIEGLLHRPARSGAC